MKMLSQWRRGLVVGALAALTAGAALAAPASASATPARSVTVSPAQVSTHHTATGKHHDAWEW